MKWEKDNCTVDVDEEEEVEEELRWPCRNINLFRESLFLLSNLSAWPVGRTQTKRTDPRRQT